MTGSRIGPHGGDLRQRAASRRCDSAGSAERTASAAVNLQASGASDQSVTVKWDSDGAMTVAAAASCNLLVD